MKIPELDRKGLRNFGWMFAAVVVSLFGLILPWLFDLSWSWIPWAIAVGFFFWGLLAPNTLRPFYRLWMLFGLVMNAVVTRIILGVVFYIVIFPYSLVFRLRGKDLMNRRWNSQLSSYRISGRKVDPKQMDKPF